MAASILAGSASLRIPWGQRKIGLRTQIGHAGRGVKLVFSVGAGVARGIHGNLALALNSRVKGLSEAGQSRWRSVVCASGSPVAG